MEHYNGTDKLTAQEILEHFIALNFLEMKFNPKKMPSNDVGMMIRRRTEEEKRKKDAEDLTKYGPQEYTSIDWLLKPAGNLSRKFPCSCCGFFTLNQPQNGTYDICPVCFWEDDDWQTSVPDRAGGANRFSLTQSRENFLKFGVCEQRVSIHVRSPKPEEYPEFRYLFIS